MVGDVPIMQLLYRVAHAINASLSLDDTLQAVLGAVQEVLGARAAAIRLLNPDATALEVAASRGIDKALLARMPSRVTPDSIHERILGGQTVHTHDLANSQPHDFADMAFAQDWPDQEGISGILGVPLQVRDRPIGSLTLYCDVSCRYDKEVTILLRAIADMAALAIENARLHTSLFRIAEAITSSLELRPMLDQVLSATVLEMGLKAASVRLLDSAGKKLDLVAAHGLTERYLAKGSVTVAESPIDQRLLAGESVRVYNVSEDAVLQYPSAAQAEGIHSLLAVPLAVKGRIIGVMRVYSAQPRPFTAVGTEFLQSVAGLVAVAIENARLHAALQERYEGLKMDVSEWYRFLSLG